MLQFGHGKSAEECWGLIALVDDGTYRASMWPGLSKRGLGLWQISSCQIACATTFEQRQFGSTEHRGHEIVHSPAEDSN